VRNDPTLRLMIRPAIGMIVVRQFVSLDKPHHLRGLAEAAAGPRVAGRPFHRYHWRWFNGITWTDAVSDNVTGTDPVRWL